MEKKEKNKDQEVLHEFNQKGEDSMDIKKIVGVFLVAVVLGIGSGYILANRSTAGTSVMQGTKEGGGLVSKGTVVGVKDTKTFKDSAEGVLEEGGIEGEGQYHLVRPGGDSQNVYLTSSIVDLGKFVKRKVKVWGETNAAKSAGWLMDVGRVEVLE